MLYYWKTCNTFLNQHFHSAPIRLDDKSVQEEVRSTGLNDVPLRPMDKRVLVWSGKYKKIEDVPDRINRSAVARAYSILRVRACNIMMVATVMGCLLFISMGKKERLQGISLHNIGEARQKADQEKYTQ